MVAASQRGWPRVSPLLSLRRGDPVDVIPAFAVSEGIDLLVVGAPRRGNFNWPLRTRTAERLIDRVTCSVLGVKLPAAAADVMVPRAAAAAR
jgi:nucleotide-binding universal stress UspA family protein